MAKLKTVSIGENVEWGFEASATMRYNKNRYAGCKIKLYRFDTSSNSLILVDTSTIDSEGEVTFNRIDHGGDFIVTIE